MFSEVNTIKWCHLHTQQKYFCMELYKKNKNALLWYFQVVGIYNLKKIVKPIYLGS